MPGYFPNDPELAARAAKCERRLREQARTASMSVADRIDRWLRERNDEETEDVFDLLCDALIELRRLEAGSPSRRPNKLVDTPLSSKEGRP